jgi:hypothetical protein
MENLAFVSQAVSLSVIFYVVTYFLITWHWPVSLLSIFVSTLFLYMFRRHPVNSLSYTPG